MSRLTKKTSLFTYTSLNSIIPSAEAQIEEPAGEANRASRQEMRNAKFNSTVKTAYS
jgi:hypothetical protein